MMRVFTRRRIIVVAVLSVCFLGFSAVYLNQLEEDGRRTGDVMSQVPEAKEVHITQQTSLRTSQSDFHRLIHLDLKGAPPKISYLRQILPLFKKLGATGLLVEYEDMFPYDGNLSVLPRKEAYEKYEIFQIQYIAKEIGLIFIPLVQTFGHLEFVLKHEQFRHLRELPDDPRGISAGPCIPETFVLIKELITQMMKEHPDVTYLHIGSDEVWQLGKGEMCTKHMEDKGITKPELFLQHLSYIAGFVRKRYPGVTPIVWDDMFRKIDPNLLLDSGIGELVEPMVWKYKQNIENIFVPAFWNTYSQIFKNVWVGSAFKGATGKTKYYADTQYYVENNRHWQNIVERNKHAIHFKGIALTGWTRYNHLIGMCELLPVALPSAAYCLRLLQDGGISHEAMKDVSRSLGCDDQSVIPPYLPPTNSGINYTCSFPGIEVFTQTLELRRFYSLIKRKALVRTLSATALKKRALDIRTKLYGELPKMFDAETVHEWVQQYFDPLMKVIKSIGNKK